MSQDDDDLGGGTLVMTPEERPDMQPPAAALRPLPPPQPLADQAPPPDGVDQSWDDDANDAPGTFIMNVDHHATPANPASPFAEASKQSGAWPQVPAEKVVVGSRAATDPSIGSAQTLMGMGNLGAEVDAIIAQRGALQPHAPELGPQPPSPLASPPAAVAWPAQPGSSPAPMPSYSNEPAPMPGYPHVDSHEFPRPGSYPNDRLATGQPRGGLAPLLLGAAVGLATVTVVVGGYYGYRALKAPAAPPPSASSASTSATQSTSAPTASADSGTTSPSPSPSGAPSTPSSPPATGSDAEARAALERFGEGLKKCVAETIHVLPGTSPAVPSSLAWLKNGPYQPGIKDFQSSVYTCSKFKMTEPMPFVLQWQAEDGAGKKGSAIAWLDDDRDGKADRAFGFSATLEKRNVAIIGPVESVDASRAIKKR